MDFLRTRTTNGGKADGQGAKHPGVARTAEGTSIHQGWTYRRSNSEAGRLMVAQFDRTTDV